MLTGGLVLFTLASLACALAWSQGSLVVARGVQGVAAAIVSAVGLSMIVTVFVEPAERARALGVFSFVASGGGTLGVLLGGVVTDVAGWRTIFLLNLPIGVGVLALVRRLLERDARTDKRGRLDFAGAATVTVAVMLAILGCVEASRDRWGSATTLALLAAAVATFGVFVAIEASVPQALVPLALFRVRQLSAANALAMLVRAALFSWFFFSALYMQRVLGFSPLGTGLGFLPATQIIGALSYSLTAKLVGRVGVRAPFVAGTVLVAAGLGLFAVAPVDGTYAVDVLPGMLLVGLGGGLLFLPLILAATTSVAREDAGVASGLVSTSQQLGGALGLAVLATLAEARTRDLLADHGEPAALTGGFHLAFVLGAALALVAAGAGWALLRAR